MQVQTENENFLSEIARGKALYLYQITHQWDGGIVEKWSCREHGRDKQYNLRVWEKVQVVSVNGSLHLCIDVIKTGGDMRSLWRDWYWRQHTRTGCFCSRKWSPQGKATLKIVEVLTNSFYAYMTMCASVHNTVQVRFLRDMTSWGREDKVRGEFHIIRNITSSCHRTVCYKHGPWKAHYHNVVIDKV